MMHTIRHLALIITWLLTSVAAYASLPDTEPQKQFPAQEKVYLHFDNNCYFQGDTIWYKAYIVQADDNSPQPLSKILYTELYNEQGYLVERQQLVIDSQGQANGCFAIDTAAFAGYYEIRAYTKWMLNFGYEYVRSWYTGSKYESDKVQWPYYGSTDSGKKYDYEWERCISIDKDGMRKNYRDYSNLFSRVFPIYNQPDSSYKSKLMPVKMTLGNYEVRWKTPEFDVKFYPEGGQILEGYPCRVAWEACNQQLERLNVNGVLMEDGEIIDTIMPHHAGRGCFEFTPQKGCNYKVRFLFGKEKFTFHLPDTEKYGARLKVSQDKELICFNVAQRFKEQHQLILSLFCRGRHVKTLEVNGTQESETWETFMLLDDLPEGVNQAVLHDADGTVYADRLFFVNKLYESKGKIMVAGIANRPYEPLERIRLNLIAVDAKGRPIKNQTMSVAVRDADQLDPSFATGNIMTNLLLESELKGFIETPDYYFESDDEHHRQALDLLLMVQGWRRYDWKVVEHPEQARLDYLPEQKMVIYGEAIPLRKSLFKKETDDILISCSLLNLDDSLKPGDYYRFKGTVVADSQGRFNIVYDPFYGNAILSLRAKYIKKREKRGYDELIHDKQIFLRKQYFYPQTVKAYSWYETNQPKTIKEKKLTWEEYLNDIYASEWIPQVEIKSKKSRYVAWQADKPVYKTNVLDFVNDLWDRGYYDPFDLYDLDRFTLGPVSSQVGTFSSLRYETSINNIEVSRSEVNSVRYDASKDTLTTKKAFDMEESRRIIFLQTVKDMSIISDSPRRPTPFEHYHLKRYTEPGSIYSYGIDRLISYTTYPEKFSRITRGREYTLQGFTRPVEYYNPDYSHASLPEVKDYRRTLYWNPHLTTDNYGQVSIEFYNNSVCKLIDVSAQGISKYGQFLVNEE